MLLDLRSFADNSIPCTVVVSDASATVDALLLNLLLQPILADSTTVTELVQLPFYIILSDATTITESSTPLLPLLLVNINQESTLVMTDVPTVNWVLSMALNESTAVSESQLVLLPVLLFTVNDATGVTESVQVSWLLQIDRGFDLVAVVDIDAVVLFPLSPIIIILGEDVPLSELSGVLLPILNCAVNEVIITDDAAPSTNFLQIGGHSREIGPALITDVDSIT